MFDNIGTAIVQALGFFGVFGYFVYQLLSDSKKSIKIPLKSSKKKVNERKDLIAKPKKKGLFGRKVEPKNEFEKPKKKGLFDRKIEQKKEVVKPKKKGLFNRNV